jgi:hypothetical protein
MSVGSVFTNYGLMRSGGLFLSNPNDRQQNCVFSLPEANQAHHKEWESFDPPLCSYELLYNAFRPNKNNYTTEETKRDCWSPQDEILQIPVHAILNRNDMTKLGSGSAGGVYKAILKLNGAGADDVCIAAVKSNICRLIDKKTGWTSCLSDRTVENNAKGIESEFMGAFLYLATRKAGIEVPSLIPTWGLVVNNDLDTSTIVGKNITYPAMVGAVMPLRKFTTVEEIVEYEMSELLPSSVVRRTIRHGISRPHEQKYWHPHR